MLMLPIAAALLAADAPHLDIGSKAPPLSVEKWVKGEEVSGLAADKVYVVEFWATWCGPCIQSIPHLTKLQKDNPGVTMIGVAASERGKKDQPDTRLAGLTTFVNKQGDAMGYRVAFDEDRSMSKAWMDASGQQGIPCAFIVGKDGTIEWIGHPMEMDQPLAAVVAGSWDRSKAKAEAAARAELENFFSVELPELATKAQRSGDWKPVITRMDQLAAKAPRPASVLLMKFRVLADSNEGSEAVATAKALLGSDLSAEELNMLAWTIATEMEDNVRDLKVALAAADKAVAATKGEDGTILDTQARVHFELGDAAKALEIQTRAVDLAQKDGISGEPLSDMKAALKQYQQASKK
ncbi:MAG: TlpA family protein disulfide reductase [Planctomycetes bacterium]|nr:TlpA family protein disulfide reductase [Planctomycetota bacterium]